MRRAAASLAASLPITQSLASALLPSLAQLRSSLATAVEAQPVSQLIPSQHASDSAVSVDHPASSADYDPIAQRRRQLGNELASCSHAAHEPMFRRAYSATPTPKPRAIPPNAKYLVETGLVQPDSHILGSFKKNLERPHLTHRIMKRREVGDVRDMVRVYSGIGRGLDPFHVTAALTRLQEVLKYKPDSDLTVAGEVVRLLVPTIERSCIPKVHSLHYQFKMDAASTCLWALAKLPPVVRSEVPSHVLDALLTRATRHPGALYESAPRLIALLLWSTSKLSAPAPSTAATTPTSRPSDQAVSAAVHNIMSTRLSTTPDHKTIWVFLQHSSPAVLAMLSTSLSALGRLTLPIATALSDEFNYRMTSEHRLALKPFEPRDFVGVAQGFAAAGHADCNKLVFALIAMQVTSQPHELHNGRLWKPEHLSHLASAFAAAGIKHDGLFRLLSTAAQARREQFRGWALIELKHAFDSLGYKEAWLDLAVQPFSSEGLPSTAVPLTDAAGK